MKQVNCTLLKTRLKQPYQEADKRNTNLYAYANPVKKLTKQKSTSVYCYRGSDHTSTKVTTAVNMIKHGCIVMLILRLITVAGHNHCTKITVLR